MDPANFFEYLRAVDAGGAPEVEARCAVQGAFVRLDDMTGRMEERLSQAVAARRDDVRAMATAVDLAGPALDRIAAGRALYEEAKTRCEKLKGKIAELEEEKKRAEARELELLKRVVQLRKQLEGLPEEYAYMDPGSMDKWRASVENWAMTHELGRPPTRMEYR